MELIWPGSGAEAARRNLHQAVYSLRQTLRRGRGEARHVCFADDCYFLDPNLSLWLDFEEFERKAERGELLDREGRSPEALAELADAERLYGGDLFEDRPYDEWTMAERERLKALRHRVVSWLSDRHAERGDHRTVIELCQKLLAEDPCDEASHRRLIASRLAQGRRDLAAQQLKACEQVLRDELGVEPSAELEALRGRIAL
jgi:DNA-binding SARP family transcriptional activator